ncbi:hypothetical protein [Treponema sp.]|uniref:hypothetical protein n=1 Tax=Treponema sp. TaxID=166 RepID=UPI00298DDF9C|nr:hypothetical protein [Treponema sp.]MCR5612612.1 hypothetical protein [Treponema sp.]
MSIHNNIQTPEEKWENATIANNFIFYKVMRNNPDVFKRGRAKYRFENLCVDDTGVKFNDRTYKLFFIAENYDKILNAEQKRVLKMIMNNESTTKFSDKVSGLLEDAKHNAYWRKQFLEYEIQQRLQFNAGKKEGF